MSQLIIITDKFCLISLNIVMIFKKETTSKLFDKHFLLIDSWVDISASFQSLHIVQLSLHRWNWCRKALSKALHSLIDVTWETSYHHYHIDGSVSTAYIHNNLILLQMSLINVSTFKDEISDFAQAWGVASKDIPLFTIKKPFHRRTYCDVVRFVRKILIWPKNFNIYAFPFITFQ